MRERDVRVVRRVNLIRLSFGVLLFAALSSCKKGSDVAAPSTLPVVKSITLSTTGATIEAGTTLFIIPTLKDSAGNVLGATNYSILWTSSDTLVATVNTLGVVTARTRGSTVIVATVAGQTAAATIAVPAPVGSVTVAPGTPFVLVGGALQLSATVKDAAGTIITSRTVTWTSSSTIVANLTSTGLVTGLAQGAVTITAAAGNKTGFAQVTVGLTPPASTSAVTVTPTTATITAGGTLQLTASDANGALLAPTAVTWTSNNAAVATVSPAGLVNARASGTAIVTATNGTASGSSTITVKPAAARVTFTSVSAGDQFSCGIVTGAPSTFCWGNNDAGQLGTGTGAASPLPAPLGIVLSFTSVSTGWSHACALTADGSAFCWGDNGSGQLGDGTTTIRTTPVAVAGGLQFTNLSTGYAHTCGRMSSGAVACWGNNDNGQLGTGTTTRSLVPILVAGGTPFVAVSAGLDHTCALTAGGAALCWGGNSNGQLGTGLGIVTGSLTPIAVAGALSFGSVSAGVSHTCGVTTVGVAYCWGRNDSGELGTGSGTASLVPARVVSALTFTAVSAGGMFTCGIATGGAAYCWGDNIWNELGGGGLASQKMTPVAVSGNLAFASLNAGYFHVCGMTTSGTAFCWGDNGQGQNGDGTTSIASAPVKVAGQP